MLTLYGRPGGVFFEAFEMHRLATGGRFGRDVAAIDCVEYAAPGFSPVSCREATGTGPGLIRNSKVMLRPPNTLEVQSCEVR